MANHVLHQVVKGNSGAADLLADVVILNDARSSEDIDEDSFHNLLKRKDQPQTALKDALNHIYKEELKTRLALETQRFITTTTTTIIII